MVTQKKGRYKHYKGGQYDYLGPVIQESNGETLASYRSTKTDQVFVRPHLEFFGEVLAFGQMVPRFCYLGDSDGIRHQAQWTRPIDDLAFTLRTINRLKAAGIFYVGDLVQKSDQDLLKLHGIGRGRKLHLKDINESLAMNGLTLGMQVEKINMEEGIIAHGLQVVGAYTHYKGGHYHYLGQAIQELDSTALALYRSVDTGTLFTRPETEFFGNVVVDGKDVRRFREDALSQREPDHERLMDMIQELVQQSCGNDSAAITVYADAMRLLAAEGRCRIVSEGGRRVIVEWLPQSA